MRPKIYKKTTRINLFVSDFDLAIIKNADNFLKEQRDLGRKVVARKENFTDGFSNGDLCKRAAMFVLSNPKLLKECFVENV